MSTIAAVSTPMAAGALGVIRISGEEAIPIAEQVFRCRGKSLSQRKGYTAALGRVCDEEGDIDEAVATVFRSPKSYTGEDVVEFSCHGGPYLLTRTLRALYAAGALPAGPGEFTRRAFLNGKLSLTQAEAVMDLISCEGREAARAALSLKDGALYRKIQEIIGLLSGLCAGLGAWVDYPDDEIPELSEEELAKTLGTAGGMLQKLIGEYDTGRIWREGVDTCIAGRPNVGKSTLMNLLYGGEKSIVTQIPGTTRDLVETRVRLGDVTLNLTDTAGLRETEDPVERIGVERARQKLETAALILAVVDSSEPLEEEDRRLLSSLAERPALIIVNKTDLPPAFALGELEGFGVPVVSLSAKTGEGTEKLYEQVREVLHLAKPDVSGGILANERQLACAREALTQVEEAKTALDAGMTLDAVDVLISAAVSSLLSLTGEKAEERIIDEIFSRFCVGK